MSEQRIARFEWLEAFGWAFKYALTTGIVVLVFFTDRVEKYGRLSDEVVWQPGRALFWSVIVLAIFAYFRADHQANKRQFNEGIRKRIEEHREAGAEMDTLEPTTRLGRILPGEQFVAEVHGVTRYEVRRTRAANFAMLSLGKNSGALRARVGQFAYDAPEVWRATGTGTLIVSTSRMVWLGTTRRQEWKWHLVGDVIPDSNGLLVFGRSGRPIGLKMDPDPKLFAFIEESIGVS